MAHRFIAFFFGLVFLLFAYFQLDDGDWWRWVLIYGAAAGMSIAFFFRRTNRLLYALAAIAAILGAIYYWPPEYHGIVEFDKFAEVELARESLGLGIITIVMVYYFLTANSVKISEKVEA